jgi:hypothetical protein
MLLNLHCNHTNKTAFFVVQRHVTGANRNGPSAADMVIRPLVKPQVLSSAMEPLSKEIFWESFSENIAEQGFPKIC